MPTAALAVADDVRSGRRTATDVVEEALATIERGRGFNAVTSALTESALAAAASIDRGERGAADMPLLGVPISVKSNLDVVGSPTHQGVVALAGAIPTEDTPLVARLRAAGAIVVARGNMPDFALRWHTDNEAFGATVNPWDPQRSPGGSSGGDCVAVATGMVPLAIGNDYGGSLRVPAAACAVASLKPGKGRVPLVATLPQPPPTFTVQQFAVDGPIGTSIADLRVAFDVIAGPDPRDPWSTATAAPRRRDGVVRVGVLGRGDGSVAAALDAAAGSIASAGVDVVDIELATIELGAGAWLSTVVADIETFALPAIGPMIGRDSRVFLDSFIAGAATLGLPTPGEAWIVRHAVGAEWAAALTGVDAVLAPVSDVETPPVGFDTVGPAGAVERWRQLAVTVNVNLLGLPAVTWPVTVPGALPTAVQLIGQRGTEAVLLDIGENLEAALPFVAPG